MASWSNKYLDKMREVTDPLADDVINQVIDTHGVQAVNSMMASLTRNDELIPSDLPENVQRFLKETAVLPDWFDPEKAALGQKMFGEYGIPIVNMLFIASLPLTYTAWRGVHVLYFTQRMTKHIHRRLFETAQFIFDVTDPESLSPTGRGLRSAQKVRLMHASIRHYIKNGAKWGVHWDDAWGKPLNQEDLAGTLMAFSIIVLNGLEAFNLQPTREEREGYLHLWAVVGHIMGVHDDLIPRTVEEGEQLTGIIFDRQRGESEAGKALTKVLLGFMESLIPGDLFDGLAASSMRKVLGDDTAELLGIPKANWTRFIIRIQEYILDLEDKIGRDIPIMDRAMAFVQRKFLESLVLIDRGGDRPAFRIPPNLRDDWQLDDNPENPDLPPATPIAYESEAWKTNSGAVMTYSNTPPPAPAASHPDNIPWIMYQGWEHLLFMHWGVDPEVVRPMVPESMELDLYDGKAWITMIPFRMADVHIRDLPPVPFQGTFAENNLRIYVKVDNLPGVYFFSIDAGNRMDAWVANKFFHIPYVYAQMNFSELADGSFSVSGKRSPTGNFKAAELDVTYRPKGDPFKPAEGSLAHFLVERYYLFSTNAKGELFRGDTQHDPWTLYEAEADIKTNTILDAAGLNLPNADSPMFHYSVGTQSHMWPVVPISWIKKQE